MDLSLSDEQKMLQDSVSRFVKQSYSFDDRRKIVASGQGFSRDNWAKFAELGWLMAPFPEADGGLDGGLEATMVIMEELGKGIAVEPFIPTVVMAGGLISAHGSPEQKERYLPPIMEGALLASVAFVEERSRFNLATVATKAKKDGDGYVIDGKKGVVLHGPTADLFIVSARTSGDMSDADGISLFCIPADADGLVKRDYPTLDGQQASEITLDGVRVDAGQMLGAEGQGLAALNTMMHEALLAQGAEAVGAMAAVLQMTVEYTKTRKQFGMPLSAFQVVQHQMVDMFTCLEQAKSAVIMAVLHIPQGGDKAARAASAMKAKVAECAKFVSQTAVQLHGGMGVTDEMAVAHYMKRLTVLDTLLGNRDWHLARFVKLSRQTAA